MRIIVLRHISANVERCTYTWLPRFQAWETKPMPGPSWRLNDHLGPYLSNVIDQGAGEGGVERRKNLPTGPRPRWRSWTNVAVINGDYTFLAVLFRRQVRLDDTFHRRGLVTRSTGHPMRWGDLMSSKNRGVCTAETATPDAPHTSTRALSLTTISGGGAGRGRGLWVVVKKSPHNLEDALIRYRVLDRQQVRKYGYQYLSQSAESTDRYLLKSTLYGSKSSPAEYRENGRHAFFA